MDWRMDTLSGGNGLPPGGIICGEAHPMVLNGQTIAGGGAGYHNSIVLETLCRKHVVVSNGRVFDRGFTIHDGAMVMETSFTVPTVGRTFVVGFGGVRKRRRLDIPASIAEVTDDLFPTPDGVSFGSHPYSELRYDQATDRYTYKDRRFNWYQATGNRLYAWGSDLARTQLTVRVGPHHMLRYDVAVADTRPSKDANGVTQNRYMFKLVASRVNIVSGEVRVLAESVEDTWLETAGSTQWAYAFATYKHFGMPCGNNEFIMFPAYKWAPHIRVSVDDPLNFELMGVNDDDTVFAKGTVTVDSFYGCGSPAVRVYATQTYALQTNRPFRLFDGRFLVLPAYKKKSHDMYLLDPSNDTLDIKDPQALDLYLEGSDGGTTRWKTPVQIPSGTVMALPDVFPGNTSLFYHPTADTFERRIAAAYPRADIRHTAGQPTADGRIIYGQTYGAVADIDSFLTVWPDEDVNADTRYEINVLPDFVKSVVSAFDFGYTLSDGTMFFATLGFGARASVNTTNFYSCMALNPADMDYLLYKYPVSNMGGVLTSANMYDIEDLIKDWNRILTTPEFDMINMSLSANKTGDISALYLMQDAPATKSMGAFIRQAYFGYCQ